MIFMEGGGRRNGEKNVCFQYFVDNKFCFWPAAYKKLYIIWLFSEKKVCFSRVLKKKFTSQVFFCPPPPYKYQMATCCYNEELMFVGFAKQTWSVSLPSFLCSRWPSQPHLNIQLLFHHYLCITDFLPTFRLCLV